MLPTAIVAYYSGDRVAKVGYSKPAVKDETHQTGGSIFAAVLAGIIQKLLIDLSEHYKKEEKTLTCVYEAKNDKNLVRKLAKEEKDKFMVPRLI